MRFTAAFVAAFVAMTWSQEVEGFGSHKMWHNLNNGNDMDDDLVGELTRNATTTRLQTALGTKALDAASFTI